MAKNPDPKPPKPRGDDKVSGQKWVEAWAKKHIGKK
jgi:hypothetical protein